MPHRTQVYETQVLCNVIVWVLYKLKEKNWELTLFSKQYN